MRGEQYQRGGGAVGARGASVDTRQTLAVENEAVEGWSWRFWAKVGFQSGSGPNSWGETGLCGLAGEGELPGWRGSSESRVCVNGRPTSTARRKRGLSRAVVGDYRQRRPAPERQWGPG